MLNFSPFENHTQYIKGFWLQILISGGGGFPHQAILNISLAVLQFNSILTLCTQIQHQIPQVKDSVLQDTPRTHPHFRCQLQAQVINYTSYPPSIVLRFL